MTLRLDWCTHEAARYAVLHWHYSKRMPHSKLVKVGAWEDGKFIGAVVFGLGATPHLCRPYGLSILQTCELLRVALTSHKAPVSRIVAISLRMVHKLCPGLRICISFADPAEGHVGGIYQAGNWIYTGRSHDSTLYWYRGRWAHGRAVSLAVHATGIDRKTLCPRRKIVPGKHRYIFPFDDETRANVRKFSLPYPKRADGVKASTPDVQSGGGGSNPTSALQGGKDGPRA